MNLSPEKMKKKDFLRAARRIDEIQKEIMSIPPRPLPQKILVGHWRYLKVRADVLRSSVGLQVSQVVRACNHWVLGKKKDPNSYRTSTEIPISSSSTSFFPEQGLRPLSQKQFTEAAFPEFFERKWFRVVEHIHRAGTKNIVVKRYFPKIPRHMLEFEYKPAYMEAEHIPSSELNAELKRLHDFMHGNHGWEKIAGRHADEWDLNFVRTRILDRDSKREIQESLFEQGL